MKRLRRVLSLASLCFMLFGLALGEVRADSDLSGHWAQDRIERLTKEGLVSGYRDGSFQPDKEISRAEFVAALNKILGLEGRFEAHFSDVKPEDWYAAALGIALKHGYISGYGDGSFRPNQPVSRLEAAVMISRANKLRERVAASREDLKLFRDASSIPAWAELELAAIVKSGIMKGKAADFFHTDGRITRAEAAVSLDRARESVNRLSSSVVVEKKEKEKEFSEKKDETLEKKDGRNDKEKEKAAPSGSGSSGAGATPTEGSASEASSDNTSPAVSAGSNQPGSADPDGASDSTNGGDHSQESSSESASESEGTSSPDGGAPSSNDAPDGSASSNADPGSNGSASPDQDSGSQGGTEQNQGGDAAPAPSNPPKPPKTEAASEGMSMEELIAHLTTQENDNVTGYTLSDGSPRAILWTKGIIAPAMAEDGSADFKKSLVNGHLDYKMDFVPGNRWYDVNKDRDQNKVLCSGAVASNMLHWWLEQNAEYVKRYTDADPNNGVLERGGFFTNLRDFVDSFRSQTSSELFQMMTAYFGATDGIWSDTTIDLFINGYKPSPSGGTNWEGRFEKDARGGFFFDVFKTKILTERANSERYSALNRYTKRFLGEGKALAISYGVTNSLSGHIYSLWGAEYDAKGKLRAIYISDSDDYNESTLGMKRLLVKYEHEDGRVRISSNIDDPNAGPYVVDLYTLSLGTDEWKAYFNIE